MQRFMTAPDGSEDILPFTFDIRAIGVQLIGEARFLQYAFAGGYIFL